MRRIATKINKGQIIIMIINQNAKFIIIRPLIYLCECVIICQVSVSDKIKLISKQQYEAQLQHVFRLVLENKSQEEIARELHISTRTVARYYQRIEQRYGEIQRQKTDNTLFLECQLFKNRMFHLYKILEKKAEDPKVNGNECAKCCEVAANIAIDVLKMESEGIKAVKDALIAEKEATRRSSSAISSNSNNNVSDMMYYDELEESC
ncbi:MAG TPA: helix-turn-helix domain-containing protein [Nitrososphaeraceae archaeon]|nr:helix-turn-helix domain-containing protein [Nitrososphaeraceae archaeon]